MAKKQQQQKKLSNLKKRKFGFKQVKKGQISTVKRDEKTEQWLCLSQQWYNGWNICCSAVFAGRRTYFKAGNKLFSLICSQAYSFARLDWYQDLKLQDLHFCVRSDRQDFVLSDY